MSLRRIDVTYSTMGQSSPASAGEGGRYYRWNGDPGKSEAARTGAHIGKPDGGPGSTGRKQKRVEDFAAALAEQGYDPAAKDIPPPAIREAGLRVGVGYDTARSYRNELKKRPLQDGEVRGD